MENQKNDNLNMLEAIVQNTEMGKNTLDQLVPMAEDEQFKAELLRQRNIYRQLNQEAHTALEACGGKAQGQGSGGNSSNSRFAFHVCVLSLFTKFMWYSLCISQCFTGSKAIVPHFRAGIDHAWVQSR